MATEETPFLVSYDPDMREAIGLHRWPHRGRAGLTDAVSNPIFALCSSWTSCISIYAVIHAIPNKASATPGPRSDQLPIGPLTTAPSGSQGIGGGSAQPQIKEISASEGFDTDPDPSFYCSPTPSDWSRLRHVNTWAYCDHLFDCSSFLPLNKRDLSGLGDMEIYVIVLSDHSSEIFIPKLKPLNTWITLERLWYAQ
jgi:hypothetical protein